MIKLIHNIFLNPIAINWLAIYLTKDQVNIY